MTEPLIYPTLADLLNLPEAGPLRVCIATPDLLGPVKNGGIGTACGYLAHALAEAGHEVTTLFCQTGAEDIEDQWIEKYAKGGIRAVNAAKWQEEKGEEETFPALPHLAMAKTVHDWLKENGEFDLVLFMEWQGAGFYAMHAKASGIAFQNTALGVVIHSPSYWHSINDGAVPASPLEACLWHMERKSIEMADFVISPSRHMLKWINDRLCRLPRYAFCQPNLLEWQGKFKHQSNKPIEEIVFFGRLEYRKGLEQFCAAMDRLAAAGKLPPKVTFLGKCAWLGHLHSAIYIANRAKKWQGCELRLETNKGHEEACAYICGPGRMAIMPSIADNSPYTVYECLAAGVPFLARDVGGINEFLPPKERQEFLFGDNPEELADKISRAVGQKPRRGTLVINHKDNAKAWRKGLPILAKLAAKSKEERPEPFISVILTHYNRPGYLAQAVESLLAQTYTNFEVILADDGSEDKAALSYLNELEPIFLERGWRILRLSNGHAAAARNRAVNVAKGDWLLFFDDDNIAKPHMLATCAKAAASRPQGGYLPIMFQVFESPGKPAPENLAEIFLPTGDAIAYSALVNTLSDTTALVHKDAFASIGGFRPDYGIGHEDFELFLRLALSAQPCAIIPEPLFYYRKHEGKASVQLNTNAALNRMRSLRPFLETLPPPLAELALMAHGMGALLHMFPDPNIQTRLDMPLDYQSDPSSAANMAAIASILASNGDTALATQILESLPDDERPARAALLQCQALAAAKKGDTGLIQSIFNQFQRQQLPDSDLPPICQAVLENLKTDPTNLRAEILSRLASLPSKTPLAWLLLAEANQNNEQDFIKNMLGAFQAAEQAYSQIRPDVGSAVSAGSFLCCLQHFILHGEVDNMPWPERPMFRKLLNAQPDLTPQLAQGHMLLLHYDDEAAARGLLAALRRQA